MGTIAAGAELVSGGVFGDGGLSVVAPVGTGIGGVIATIALIYVLVYRDLFEPVDYDVEGLRGTLIGAAVPLLAVFVMIVLYHAWTVIARAV